MHGQVAVVQAAVLLLHATTVQSEVADECGGERALSLGGRVAACTNPLEVPGKCDAQMMAAALVSSLGTFQK
jgi:hypothetical protein